MIANYPPLAEMVSILVMRGGPDRYVTLATKHILRKVMSYTLNDLLDVLPSGTLDRTKLFQFLFMYTPEIKYVNF